MHGTFKTIYFIVEWRFWKQSYFNLTGINMKDKYQSLNRCFEGSLTTTTQFVKGKSRPTM